MEEPDGGIVPSPATAQAGHGRGGRGSGVGHGIGASLTSVETRQVARADVMGVDRERGSGKPVLKNPIG
jgi:hypothetical protein